MLVAAVGRDQREEDVLFGKNYGSMTPVGLLMGHAMFGIVVGLVYTAIV